MPPRTESVFSGAARASVVLSLAVSASIYLVYKNKLTLAQTAWRRRTWPM